MRKKSIYGRTFLRQAARTFLEVTEAPEGAGFMSVFSERRTETW